MVPRLAERGEYVGSDSTVFRVLRAAKQAKHRASSRAPVPRPRELVASAPNQIWSWDITYLKSSVRGEFFDLYLFLDVWSRKIVGWDIRDSETMEHSSALVPTIAEREGIPPGQVTLHSDNGGPMKGATMRATLDALGIMESFSRPRVSNDNPHSESLFRTLKYRPEYPRSTFADRAAACAWVAAFVDWYNLEHRHSAIRYVTPEQRHSGAERQILQAREQAYAAARARHPGRWTGPTRCWTPIGDVVLNPGRALRLNMAA